MCYKRPGPRCSSHAGATLVKLESSHKELLTELRSTHAHYQEAMEKARAVPQGQQGTREAKNLLADALELQSKTLKLKAESKVLAEKRRLAQRDYDGTKKGQKYLQEKIDNFDKVDGDFSEFTQLMNRKTSSRMLYSWRKNKLDLEKQEAKTGKTVKQQRGKFISLSDRDTTKATEMDDATFNAVIKMGYEESEKEDSQLAV